MRFGKRSFARYFMGLETKKGTSKRSPFQAAVARLTGLEPATPGVTGRYSNQLSYNRPLHSPGRPGAFGCSMVRALCRQARFVRKYENFASCSWGVWGPTSRLQIPRCSPRVRGALIGLVAAVERVGQRNGIAFLASHITPTRMVHGGCTKTLHKLHRQFFLVADRTSLNGRGVLGRKSLELPTQTDRLADGPTIAAVDHNKRIGGEVVGRERLELPTSSV
jgi:hypothetical protein